MKEEELQNIRWMKSRPLPLEFDASRIDIEAGILYDVVMAEEGEAKGHGVHLEAEFIDDLVAYDVKHFSKRGLKSRFGHPGASDDTLGTQMGYFFNFRSRKKSGKMQAIADLHLLDAADLSPTKPNMKQWVMAMAEEAPDFLMMSIVFRPGRYYQWGKNSKKKYVWEYVITKDESGDEYAKWVSSDPALGKVFVEFGAKGEHFYTDGVEAGAATNALFSREINPHLYVAQADEFLHDHPHIKSFMQQHPDKVAAFLATIGVHINLKMAQETPPKTLLQKFLSAFSAEDEQAFRQEIFALQTAKDAADKRVEQLTAQVDSLQTTVNELKTAADNHATELAKRDARITELEGLAADVPTGGPVPPNGTDKKDDKYSAEQQDKIREKLRSK